MIITLTHKDNTQTVFTTDNEITYASVVNLITTNENDGTIQVDREGRMLLEIQDSKKGQIDIEDRVIFYEIYNAIYNNVMNENLIDVSLADNTTQNILFSTSMLGYCIEKVRLQDRGLTIEPIEYDNTNKSICIQITLAREL